MRMRYKSTLLLSLLVSLYSNCLEKYVCFGFTNPIFPENRATQLRSFRLQKENVRSTNSICKHSSLKSDIEHSDSAFLKNKEGKAETSLSTLPLILSCPVGEVTYDIIRSTTNIMSYLSSKQEVRSAHLNESDVSQMLAIDLSSPRNNAQLVEELLDRLLEERDRNNEWDTVINTETFNIAIRAWANAEIRGSAQRAENILSKLIARYDALLLAGHKNANLLRPDVYSFGLCFQAWHHVHMLQQNNQKESKAALRKADAILQLLKESLSGKMHVVGNIKDSDGINSDFCILLNSWSRSGKTNVSKMSDYFLSFLERTCKLGEEYKFMWPSTRTYNCVIKSLVKDARQADSTDRAESILKRMGDTADTISYTSLISCWANTGNQKAAKRARDILTEMEVMYTTKRNKRVMPDTITYNAVINIYSKSKDPNACNDAESLLRDMKNGKSLAKPDVRSYNLVLGVLARHKGAQYAEDFLRQMERNYDAGESRIRPNDTSFTICIDSWASQGDVVRATKVLDWMERSYRNGNNDALPTSRSFESVLYAWSKSGKKNAGERAEEIFNRMEKMKNAGNINMRPTTRTYNAVLNAISNARSKKFAVKAEEILSQMETLKDSGELEVAPDSYTYSSVIKAWSKSGEKDSGLRAEAILNKMKNAGIEPNSHHFNSAIAAFGQSNSKNAAQKAEALLNQMEELYNSGNTRMKPNSFSFTIVIDSWAKSGEKGSAQRAEILLKLMEIMYQKGNTSVKPNVHVYTTVINSWAKSGEPSAGEHADKLLERMEKLYEKGNKDIKPNTYTYTAVIDAHIKSGQRGAEEHANMILKRMEKLYTDGDSSVKPNTKTYNTVINAWSKSGQLMSAQKAESILSRMESLSEAGDKDIKPTVVTYTSVINAWVLSSSSGKAQKAWDLLRKMDEMYQNGNKSVKPNVVAYSSVINACALSKGDEKEKKHALDIAYKAFKELEESPSYGFPNHVTYSNFIKACARLIVNDDKKREKVIATIFRKCCIDGQVNASVLTQLRNAATDQMFSSLMGGARHEDLDSISIADLPEDWSRNVERSRKSNIYRRTKTNY